MGSRSDRNEEEYVAVIWAVIVMFGCWTRIRSSTSQHMGKRCEGTAVFLASKASDFVNGQIIYVDGGILATIGKPSNED